MKRNLIRHFSALLSMCLISTLSHGEFFALKAQERFESSLGFMTGCSHENISWQCLNEEKSNVLVFGAFTKCSDFAVTACGNKYVYTRLGQTLVLTSSDAKKGSGFQVGMTNAIALAVAYKEELQTKMEQEDAERKREKSLYDNDFQLKLQ